MKHLYLLAGLGFFFLLAGLSLYYYNSKSFEAAQLGEIDRKSGFDEEKLFNLVQQYRADSGRKPFKQSKMLCNIARIRLEEVKDNFSHEGFSDWQFCPGCGLAENLAKGYGGKEQLAMDAWLNSASHSANLNAGYPRSCLKTNGEVVVQIFGYF